MSENQEHQEHQEQPVVDQPIEEPKVVQVVYQVPVEDAPIPPSHLSVLEGRTGAVLIFIFAIWGLLWYMTSDPSETPETSTEFQATKFDP